MAVKFFSGRRSQLFMAIRQLVLAGLPTTRTLQSSAAAADRALPWTVKMAPLASSRSARSMPLVRGREPTRSATSAPSKAGLGLVGLNDAAQQREGAVVELHGHAPEGVQSRRDLQQLELDRLVRAQQVAVGDAEEEAVADLAGGAGHGYAGGGGHGSHATEGVVGGSNPGQPSTGRVGRPSAPRRSLRSRRGRPGGGGRSERNSWIRGAATSPPTPPPSTTRAIGQVADEAGEPGVGLGRVLLAELGGAGLAPDVPAEDGGGLAGAVRTTSRRKSGRCSPGRFGELMAAPRPAARREVGRAPRAVVGRGGHRCHVQRGDRHPALADGRRPGLGVGLREGEGAEPLGTPRS